MPNTHLLSDRLIKKYPNRRLYDTQDSVYITLQDVREMVRCNESFMVVDARSGDDLTRSVLLQIVMEEEEGGMPLLSSEMLAAMIRSYGRTVQGMMEHCLEKSLQTFSAMQDSLTLPAGGHDNTAAPEVDLSSTTPSIALFGQFSAEQSPDAPPLNA